MRQGVLPIAAVASVVVIGGALFVAAASARSSAGDTVSRVVVCPKYVVLASRGSGEENLQSVPGSQLVAALRANLGGTANVKVIPNPYPAVGALSSMIGGYLKLPAGYHDSVVAGKTWLRVQLRDWASRCGSGTRLVLTGYSQGAQVTGDVVQESGLITGTLKKMLLGVVLFGDPYFNGSDAGANRGDYQRGLNGVLTGLRPRPKFGSQLTVLSYCHRHDTICQVTDLIDFGKYRFTRHSNYGALGEPQDAAGVLAESAKGLGSESREVFKRQGNSLTVTRGIVRVSFDWRAMNPLDGRGRVLTVERSGARAYNADGGTSTCSSGCQVSFDLRDPSRFIRIAQLDNDPEAEIAVMQFEGPGSRCCSTLIVLDWTPRGYRRTEENFTNGGVSFVAPDTSGMLLVASSHAAFTYEYACGDCSDRPILLYRLVPSTHQLRESTCRYPALIEADSERLRAKLQALLRSPRSSSNGSEARGTAAPWVADEVRLGRGARAFTQLATWASDGFFDETSTLDGTTAEFIAKLRRDLPRFGIRRCA